MQVMGMIFAGQEQQRVTNGWVAKSTEAISASSGCAIEASPAPQEIVALPPALVRMATQPPPGGGTTRRSNGDWDGQGPRTQLLQRHLQLLWAGGGVGASPLSLATKRNIKPRSTGAASSTASAILSAAGTPPRKRTGLPPGHGAASAPEEMDGLGDDDGDFGQYNDVEEYGEDGKPHPYGTAEVLKCLYADLYGNVKPTTTQMMVEGERERSPSEIEADAKRVEEKLLTATLSPQDF